MQDKKEEGEQEREGEGKVLLCDAEGRKCGKQLAGS